MCRAGIVPLDPPEIAGRIREPGEDIAEEVRRPCDNRRAVLRGAFEDGIDVVHVDPYEGGGEGPVWFPVGDHEHGVADPHLRVEEEPVVVEGARFGHLLGLEDGDEEVDEFGCSVGDQEGVDGVRSSGRGGRDSR